MTRMAVRVEVFGLVQGVYFRVSARHEALHAGVCGWVRNRRDGGVEALYQGPSEAVDRLVAWSHVGPRGARVDEVRVRETEPDPRFESGFSVIKDLPS